MRTASPSMKKTVTVATLPKEKAYKILNNPKARAKAKAAITKYRKSRMK